LVENFGSLPNKSRSGRKSILDKVTVGSLGGGSLSVNHPPPNPQKAAMCGASAYKSGVRPPRGRMDWDGEGAVY
jgi:hypothetical protein